MIKKLIYIIFFCFFSQLVLAAGSDSSSDSDSDNYLDKYKSAKKLVDRAKKLENKGKTEKAIKLYNSAYNKLLEANKMTGGIKLELYDDERKVKSNFIKRRQQPYKGSLKNKPKSKKNKGRSRI